MQENNGNGLTRRTTVVVVSTALLGLVSSVWGLSRSFQAYRTEENRSLILEHREDMSKHMQMERQIDLFVLRKEYEKDLRDIKTRLQSIDGKLDQIRGGK